MTGQVARQTPLYICQCGQITEPDLSQSSWNLKFPALVENSDSEFNLDEEKLRQNRNLSTGFASFSTIQKSD